MDSGMYKFNFLHPTSGEITQSEEIYGNSSAATMRDSIAAFFSNNYGTSITVVLEYYDAEDNLLETADDAVKYLYTVSLLKRISSFSFSSVTFLSGGTEASVIITPPEEVQLSGAPIQGSFIITCTDSEGFEWSTDGIPYNSGQATV
jgi:hypothetical protein